MNIHLFTLLFSVDDVIHVTNSVIALTNVQTPF